MQRVRFKISCKLPSRNVSFIAMMLAKRTRPKNSGRGNGSSSDDKEEEPIQLYRPSSVTEDTDDFLDRDDLTDDDIAAFVAGKLLLPKSLDSNQHEGDGIDSTHAAQNEAFRSRRSEIRQLSDKLAYGEARIDDDGRLVPTGEPQPPNANLPPGPQPRNNNEGNNNNNPQVDIGLFGGAGGGGGDRQEAEAERIVEQETREAAAAIARAVQRYRDQGVPEEDFEVILIEPRGRGTVNLTFRRICIAVLAVVTAFVCVILQTLPLLDSNFDKFDPDFDKLLYDLLHVRFIQTHAKHCPGLHRQGSMAEAEYNIDLAHPTRWYQFALLKNHLSQILRPFQSTSENCDDGVLHIPAKQVLLESYIQSASPEEAALNKLFARGVNVSWFLPCQPLTDAYSLLKASPVCENSIQQVNSHGVDTSKCFRGVHDSIASDAEIDTALRLGNNLIVDGGDHFTIHYDVSHLRQRIPTLLEKLQTLLDETYHVQQDSIEPFAFRIYTVGPMDAHGVNLYRSPAFTLNRTVRTNENRASFQQLRLTCFCLTRFGPSVQLYRTIWIG